MARPAPVGAVVSLYFDGHVNVDDVIRTTSGRCYRVQQCRVQQRGKHVGRRHLAALVIDPADVTPADTVVPLYWYSRAPRRQRT